MEMRHLEYFVEVARQKSFSKAAAKCHVTQSTISKLIKDLEMELGTSLFNRTSKYVQLTDKGAIFLDQAIEVVTMFENLTGEFQNRVKMARGKVSIGLLPITGTTIFAELLGEFKKKYPQIEISLSEHGSKKVALDILDGTLDAGVVCNVPDSHYFDSFPFAEDPLCVIVSAQNPISKLAAIDLKSLAKESFVLYSSEFSLHDEIISKCKNEGFTPNVVFETSQFELMTQMVAADLGIAFLPGAACRELDPRRIAVLPVTNPKLLHNMSIIWKRGRAMSHAATLWLQFAAEFFGKN
jgi:DNA-binding transcriptional LysR family regulator